MTQFAQQWPDEVIRRAVRLRHRGLGYIRISRRLAETVHPALRWDLIRDWCNGKVKCVEKIMSKLVWRTGGHLSVVDAGQALCGAPVRFYAELEKVAEAGACRACLLRAESQMREYSPPVRQERRVDRGDGQVGLGLEAE